MSTVWPTAISRKEETKLSLSEVVMTLSIHRVSLPNAWRCTDGATGKPSSSLPRSLHGDGADSEAVMPTPAREGRRISAAWGRLSADTREESHCFRLLGSENYAGPLTTLLGISHLRPKSTTCIFIYLYLLLFIYLFMWEIFIYVDSLRRVPYQKFLKNFNEVNY